MVLSLALTLLVGCAKGPGCEIFDDACTTALQDKLDEGVADLDIIGAAMGLADADQDQLWTGAAGLSDVATAQAWTSDRAFHIGSVTKTFTTAIVMQLSDEGQLSLDDPLEAWVPGYYDGVGITLRHLLSHTSGIASYNYVGNFDDSVPWTPTQLVDWAVAVEPDLSFEPGSWWKYSNTNFVLLGLAIEAATGESYEAQVQARLTGPLGLDDTYVALSGNVSAESLALMTTQLTLTDGTVVEHGLGTFVEDDGVDRLVGHTGGFQGYQTYLYYWEADAYALAVVSNQLETNMRTLAGYGWSVPLRLAFP